MKKWKHPEITIIKYNNEDFLWLKGRNQRQQFKNLDCLESPHALPRWSTDHYLSLEWRILGWKYSESDNMDLNKKLGYKELTSWILPKENLFKKV